MKQLHSEIAFVACGLTGVGKIFTYSPQSSLLREMKDPGQRSTEYEATCVCDVVTLPSGVDKGQLLFYDMAGSSAFLTGRVAIYAHAFQRIHGVILVFDIADRKSFDALEMWYRELDIVFPLHDRSFVKILVGNKLDRQTLCTSMKEMENWAENHGFRICLTAAIDGRGVSEICPVCPLLFLAIDDGVSSMLQFLSTAVKDSQPSDIPAAGDPQPATHEVTPEQVFAVYRILNGENDWERLGVPVNSNAALITKAYRKIAAQIHPDKCPLNRSEDAFKLLSTSKDALMSQIQKP